MPAHASATRKLLRYGRFYQLARTVQELRDFQGEYELIEVPRIRDYILKCTEDQDQDRSYRKSLAIEPRRPAPTAVPTGGGGPAGQRTSGGSSKGLFQSGTSNSDDHTPTKLKKLSFFRKSTRNERT